MKLIPNGLMILYNVILVDKQVVRTKKNYCLIVDGVHLKIMPQQLKSWSKAINTDEATIEDCSPALIKTLMPARSTQKNPLRVQAAKPAEQTSNATPTAIPPPHHGQLYQQMPPIPYYPYPPPYSQPMYQPHQDRSGYSPHPRPSTTQVSSPLRFETDKSSDKLTEYFEWLAQGYPGKAQQIKECMATLIGEDIMFATLTDISTELWKEWKVPTGLVLLVKGHMKKWERELSRKRN